jgi:hypothetical protein
MANVLPMRGDPFGPSIGVLPFGQASSQPQYQRTNTRKLKMNSRNVTRRLKNLNQQTKIEVVVDTDTVSYPDLTEMTDAEPMFTQTILEEIPYGEYVGRQRITIAEERAKMYLNYFGKAFEQSIEPRDKRSCFGILYHPEMGPPIALDPSTTLQGSLWPTFAFTITEANSPIFILHEDGAKLVRPEEVKEYADLFPV